MTSKDGEQGLAGIRPCELDLFACITSMPHPASLCKSALVLGHPNGQIVVIVQRNDGPWGVDVKGSRFWYAHTAGQTKQRSQKNVQTDTQAVTCVRYIASDSLTQAVYCPDGMLVSGGAHGEVRFWRVDYALAGNGAWTEVTELAFDLRDYASDLLPGYVCFLAHVCAFVCVRLVPGCPK